MADRRPSPGPAIGRCRVGVDLTAVDEVVDALDRFGDRYARRLFTDHELAAPGGRGRRSAESLAARFAAKEAVVKILAPTGARPAWRDIEVRRRPNGSCAIALHGRAAELAASGGVDHLAVSLSHEAGVAVAVVVGTEERPAVVGCDDGEQSTTAGPGVAAAADRRPEKRSTPMSPADTADTADRVRAVLAGHARLPVDVASLGDDDDLFQAGMTSHASVNVMLALEDAFDVEFPESMLRKSTFSSIGALTRAIGTLTAAQVVA